MKNLSLYIKVQFISLLFLCHHAYGLQEKYTNSIACSQIVANGSVTTTDPHYAYMMANQSTWGDSITNESVRNIIRLYFDMTDKTHYTAAWDVTLSLNIVYQKDDFTQSTVGKTLYISYDPSANTIYNDQAAYEFSGGHITKVSILSVSVNGVGSTPCGVTLENNILIDRNYNVDPSLTSTMSSSINTTTDQVEISWDPIPGVDGYELEWQHINDYDGSGGYKASSAIDYNFTESATRVRTQNTSYSIPNLFEHGYVVYRVRGRYGNWYEPDQIDHTDWTTITASAAVSLINNKIQISTAHESDSLNWQYQARYGERGLRAEGVQYLDGAGKPRQQLQYSFSSNQPILTQVYYDDESRPVMRVLPTPTGTDKMMFYEKFNRDDNGGEWTADDYIAINPLDSCEIELPEMDTAYGSSKYYSANNADLTGHNKYIPDAEGYPFSFQKYYGDASGRVKAQGSFGEDFQVDQGHEVIVHYSSANQNELNEFFGTEAGLQDKYKKVVTQDPNGQYSSSIHNMSGQVIATTIIGESPSGIDALNSNGSPTSDSVSALNNDPTNPGEYLISSQKSVFVQSEGNHTIKYGVDPTTFTDACLPTPFCYDCVYILELSLIDECGDEMVPAAHRTDTIGDWPNDTVCGAPSSYTKDFTAYLYPGEYLLKKKLTVFEPAADYYADKFLDQANCLLTYNDFYKEEFDSLDFSGCNVDPCDLACVRELGTKADYPGSDAEYDSLFAVCLSRCGTGTKCEGMYYMMRADVMPGGQYGEFFTGVVIKPSAFDLSVYNDNNDLPSSSSWRDVTFADEAGTPDSVLNSSGTLVPVNHSSIDFKVFLSLWKTSYADSLVELHPEYCYYVYCTTQDTSNQYDLDMANTHSFAEAKTLGFINPLNMGSPVPTCIGANTTNLDPFFQTGGGGSGLNTWMTNQMTNYIKVGSTNYDIWQISMSQVLCPNDTDFSSISSCLSGQSCFGNDTCISDQLWYAFRANYQALKMYAYDSMMTNYAIENECYNGCIGLGSIAFDQTDKSFTCYPVNKTPNCGLNEYDGYGDDDQPCSSNNYAKYKFKERRGSYYSKVYWSDLDSIRTAYLDSMRSEMEDTICKANCDERANQWMAAMAPCNIAPQTLPLIVAELKELCKAACDSGYFMPKSSARGYATSNGNTTFEEVMDYHLGSGWQNDTCNELLFDATPHDYDRIGETGILDTCGCNRILETRDDYWNGSAPSGITSASEYYTDLYGYFLPDFDQLACTCEDAFALSPSYVWSDRLTDPTIPWSTESIDHLDSISVIVPEDLNCVRCIDCSDLSTHRTAFESKYNIDTSSSNYYAMFTKYLNFELDFHASEFEIREFDEKCLADALVCTNPNQNALDFIYILNAVIAEGYLLTANDEDVGSLQGVTNLGLYQWLLTQSDPVYYDAGTLGADDLDFTLGDCNYNLSLVAGETFPTGVDFNNLVEIQNIRPKSTTSGANDELYCDGVFYKGATKYILDMEIETSPFCVEFYTCDLDIYLCDSTALPLVDTNRCRDQLIAIARQNAQDRYETYIDSVRTAIRNAFLDSCRDNLSNEYLKYIYLKHQYHSTLYYYDQAGNLVKTIPPHGLDVAFNDADVDSDRIAGNEEVPNHTMESRYRYNTYNQLVYTTSPDEGASTMWYDLYDRPIVSQNALQTANDDYAYTLYDDYGRVTEVGIVNTTTAFDDTKAESASSFDTWLSGGTKREIIRSFYDEPLDTTIYNKFEGGQANLRLRVATRAYYESDVADTLYDHATHFSYDVLGNVVEVVQDNPSLEHLEQDEKHVEYEHDLLTGNVNEVIYQKDAEDENRHLYEYDEDNRLEEVFTSNEDVLWDREATYHYYDHGPLARVELGEHQVQGIDFAYSINGWLKLMNSDSTYKDFDMGTDGSKISGATYWNTQNTDFAVDALGLSLGYYEGDYVASGGLRTGTLFETNGSGLGSQGPDMWNGNIKHMALGIDGWEMQGKGYNYDQLHRLTGMTVYENEAFVSSEWKWSSGGALSDYATTISYDPAGNIDSLSRNGFAGVQTTMDQMAYHYVSGTNRLDYVNDHVNASTYADDIESGMSANNYTYDDLGRLISDNQENITSILWNAMNKVKFVDRSGSYDDTYYEYDAFGRRVMRCAISTSGDSTFTYYVYDAGGTPLAIYGREYDDMGATDFEDKIYLEDNPIYGSARHGSNKRNLLLADTSYITSTGTGNVYTVDTIARLAGLRYYELKGHTGNVYVVISDRKEAQDNNTDGTVDEYEPDILARNDYYAFGMVMPGRSENPTLYRYAFDGLEGDHSVAGNNLSYTTYFRQYDPRLGRWKSPDPVIHPWESAYAGFADNPILYIDPMGNAAGAVKSIGDGIKAIGQAIANTAKTVGKAIKDFFVKAVPHYSLDTYGKATFDGYSNVIRWGGIFKLINTSHGMTRSLEALQDKKTAYFAETEFAEKGLLIENEVEALNYMYEESEKPGPSGRKTKEMSGLGLEAINSKQKLYFVRESTVDDTPTKSDAVRHHMHSDIIEINNVRYKILFFVHTHNSSPHKSNMGAYDGPSEADYKLSNYVPAPVVTIGWRDVSWIDKSNNWRWGTVKFARTAIDPNEKIPTSNPWKLNNTKSYLKGINSILNP